MIYYNHITVPEAGIRAEMLCLKPSHRDVRKINESEPKLQVRSAAELITYPESAMYSLLAHKSPVQEYNELFTKLATGDVVDVIIDVVGYRGGIFPYSKTNQRNMVNLYSSQSNDSNVNSDKLMRVNAMLVKEVTESECSAVIAEIAASCSNTKVCRLVTDQNNSSRVEL